METQENQLNGSKKRRSIVLGIGGVVLAILIVLVAVNGGVKKDPYKGLTLIREIQMDDETKQMIEDRITVSQAALKAQQKASSDPRDWDWDLYESIATDAYRLGDLVLARETYEDYFELNSINYIAWNNYGNILKWMGDVEGAEFAYKQAKDLYAAEEYYRDYYEYIADNYEDRDDELLQILEEGVVEVGQTPWFMVELAQWYTGHNECQKAYDHYEVAITLDPDNEAIKDDLAAARQTCVEAE